MKNYIAKADKKTSTSSEVYSMYVGRWQPWHDGHQWLIDQSLDEGKNVLLCIRDVAVDEKNPWTAQQIFKNLEVSLKELIEEGRVKLMIIPDIESINWGRGVGYDLIEHVPPQEIHDISATKIREKMKSEGKL